MKMIKRKKFFLVVSWFVFLAFWFGASPVGARENVTNWYIKDFDSRIVVNQDSSLDITEKITADCGKAVDKHGILRILPEQVKLTNGRVIKNPVKLISITDFSGHSIEYSESRNFTDKTVAWKIGDPDRTVQGVNEYEIHYQVQNAIRFGNAEFDELYWNLNGNFWELETDKFHASLVFPDQVNKDDSKVDYYAGTLGSQAKDSAAYHWSAPNVLEFESTRTLMPKEGITASVTFPKGIFAPYEPGLWEKYQLYFFLAIPLAVLLACFNLWQKYGKDPRVDKTVIAEYEAPGGLSPIEVGVLMKNGSFSNNLITAEIINLAVLGIISIKEIENKILFFHSKDYELTKNDNAEALKKLNQAQELILNGIFGGKKMVKLSSLKNEFYKVVKSIDKAADDLLVKKSLISKKGLSYQIWFFMTGIVTLMLAGFVFGGMQNEFLAGSLFLSGLIVLGFSFVMPKRTKEGAELNWQIKGFRLFMETVDKDRAKFYEKENIFEKFLPYAIVFGITKQWIKKMKEIYGEEYFQSHVPVWYVGANMASFDADSFSSAISSLSSSIAANTSSPSGSGGSGGSGGGGGGGGGGGW